MGTKHMVEDAQEAGGRLGKIAMNYIEYERDAAALMKALSAQFAALRLPQLP